MTQFLKYHGGKYYLKHKIRCLLPPHELYVEPFLGGGAVLQEHHGRRVGADVDKELIALWSMLRDNPDFIPTVKTIPYTLEAWDTWTSSEKFFGSELERAIHKLISLRFSRGGLGTAFAWSERLRGGQPGDVNAWENFKKALPKIRSRIINAMFRCYDYQETFGLFDSPETCFYCDPPYYPSTRTAPLTYLHEMTKEQHEVFLEKALALRGKVVISGYSCTLYETILSGWNRYTFDMPNNAGQDEMKSRRLEVVWVKP